MFPLEIRGLTKRFGGVRAVDDVSFRVREGTIMSLIGPNGAGKTTLFNCLTGLTRPTKGNILFLGRELSGLAASGIAEAGLARTFQNIRLFSQMTVLENVMAGVHCRVRYGLVGAVLRGAGFRAKERDIKERAFEYLERVGLDKFAGELSGNLSYGSRRRLEIARALATQPRVLLLDEPTAGMNTTETSEVMGLIKEIRQLGITVILIEHDMKLVMGISDRVLVLDHGVKIAEGGPEEVRNDPLVIEAYLGSEAVHC